MTAVAVLTKALARGGKVVWDPPDRPRLLAPPSLHEAIKADRATVKEILRRAAIFREQADRFVRSGGLLPILTLTAEDTGGGCISCGEGRCGNRYRCAVCTLAVKLALEGKP